MTHRSKENQMEYERYGHAEHRERTEHPSAQPVALGHLDLALPSQLVSFVLSLIGAPHAEAHLDRVAKSVASSPEPLPR